MTKHDLDNLQLSTALSDVDQTKQAMWDAQSAVADAEWRVKELSLRDRNLANSVMSISYSKLRRYIKHNG